jgi:hypothetical protein
VNGVAKIESARQWNLKWRLIYPYRHLTSYPIDHLSRVAQGESGYSLTFIKADHPCQSEHRGIARPRRKYPQRAGGVAWCWRRDEASMPQYQSGGTTPQHSGSGPLRWTRRQPF